MTRLVFTLLFMVMGGAAWGQCSTSNYPACPGSPSNPVVYNGPIDVNPANPISAATQATGGNTPITLANRAQQSLHVEDFGAAADCVTDDTAAFNSYAAYLRSLTGANLYQRAFNLGTGRCYALAGSVNLTALGNLNFDGHGSSIQASVATYCALDAVQSGNSVYQNFNLIGTGSLRCGLQLGRPLNATSGASENTIQNVFMDGTFTPSGNSCGAPICDRASETTSYVNVTVNNRYSGSGGYGRVLDGDAHFQITSLYAATYNSGNPSQQDALYPYANMSFNESISVGGTIGNYYGPAVWMSNVHGPQFIGTYVAGDTQSAASAAAVLYFHAGDTIFNLNWDVHSEPSNLTSDLLVTGTLVASPVINGLIYKNHDEVTAGSIFALGGSATSATIHGLVLSVPNWINGGTFVFDNGLNWTVDGYAYTGSSGTWNGPATVLLDNAGTMVYGGSLASSVAFPSTLSLSGITNAGAVSGVAITNVGSNAYIGAIPSCSLAAPPSGGSQATCAIATVGFTGQPNGNWGGGTGTGYNVNDIVTFNDSNCGTPVQIEVATVSGGVPQTMTSAGVIGSCPASEMLLTAIPVTGGHGTGLLINASIMRWQMLTASVSGGAGYTGAPSVTFGTSSCCTSATGTSSVGSGGFAVTAGGVQGINVTASATTLSAASGKPVNTTSPFQLPSYIVSTLPACSSVYEGALAYVTDASSPTYNGSLTGSSTGIVPVFCNGTAWTSH
jgi:hypothetical protein